MKVATLMAERPGMVANSPREIPARPSILGKDSAYLEKRHEELLLFSEANHGRVENSARLKEAVVEVIENGATPKTKLVALRLGLSGCGKGWWTSGCAAEIADKYLANIRQTAGSLSVPEKKLIKGELISILETHLLGDLAYLKIVHAIGELEHKRGPVAGVEPLREPARV